MIDHLVEVTVAVLSSGGLAAVALQRAKAWRYKKGVALHRQGLKDIASAYSVLNRLVAALPCNRAMVIRSRNNGGIPAAGCSIYVAIVHEVYAHTADSIRGKWDERPADETYSKLLLRVSEEDNVVIEADNLPESEIKDLYLASHTRWSSVFRLCTTPEQMLYLSINFTDEHRELEPAERVVVDQCTADLQRLFHRGPLHDLYTRN